MRLVRFCLCLMFLMGWTSAQAEHLNKGVHVYKVDSFLNSLGLPNWYAPDPIKFKVRNVKGLYVFTYATLEDLKRRADSLKIKTPWGFGHSLYSGLEETARSVGGSPQMFKEEILFGLYIEKPVNAILHVEDDGRFTCEHEFEHALKSKVWDNSGLKLKDICN